MVDSTVPHLLSGTNADRAEILICWIRQGRFISVVFLHCVPRFAFGSGKVSAIYLTASLLNPHRDYPCSGKCSLVTAIGNSSISDAHKQEPFPCKLSHIRGKPPMPSNRLAIV